MALLNTHYPCAFSGIFAPRSAWIARACFAILMVFSLSACGFKLRGAATLPYESIHVAAPANSQLAADLRRNLAAAANTKIVDDPKTAALRVQLLSDVRDKQVLSTTARGEVAEYVLHLRITIKALDAAGKEVLAPTEFAQKREIPFNVSAVLAKEAEEALLYREMQSDIMQNIVRRIAALSPAERR
jgi:LPS-assembly lipoprotein